MENTYPSGLSMLSKLNIPAKFLLETVFTVPSYKDCFLKDVLKEKALKIDHTMIEMIVTWILS